MKVAQPSLTFEQAHATPLRYREDIDGLRAVAVLPVLLYHAFPKLVPGGFVGVDIFFVISGFLITGIIHQQMLCGSFSIADFYARRIRRIFPALVTVVLVTFIIGWYALPPRDLKSLGTNIAGGAVFIQNFVLLGQVSYFDLAADREAASAPVVARYRRTILYRLAAAAAADQAMAAADSRCHGCAGDGLLCRLHHCPGARA